MLSLTTLPSLYVLSCLYEDSANACLPRQPAVGLALPVAAPRGDWPAGGGISQMFHYVLLGHC